MVFMEVAIRVVEAELFRSFDSFGRMDPFAVVILQTEDGSKEIAHTKTHRHGHKTPKWDHTCVHEFYQGQNHTLEFQVKDTDWGGMLSNFCGSCVISVDDFFEKAKLDGVSSSAATLSTVPPFKLPLQKKTESTGTITLQAAMVVAAERGRRKRTTVGDWFEDSVEPLGVSGGTAAFFRLHLKPNEAQHLGKKWSETYFIGKDLAHAQDELGFYEEGLVLSRTPDQGGFGPLLASLCEYSGVLTVPSEGGQSRELLVLRNLRDGAKKLRLLDFKIGQQTGVAGWQGKSKMAALRQNMVDGMTNSSKEGFRLEGLDGAPPVVDSMTPLLDIGGISSKSTRKKVGRLMVQGWASAEVFMHFMDVHQEPVDPGDEEIEVCRSPTELAEIVLCEVVCRLSQLCRACRRAPAPQKWIGSSVGVGFDAGTLPLRSVSVDDIRESVRVTLFDWGRSELNSLSNHGTLSAKDQQDREKFWQYYCGGIDRLAWEAARAYAQRFGCTQGWDEVDAILMDFDALSSNDFLGKARLCLQPCMELDVPFLDHKQREVKVKGRRCMLTYSVAYRELENDRLKGEWRVTLHRAVNVPAADLRGHSDPFLVLVATSGPLRLRQQTCVFGNEHSPVWEETLSLPVVAHSDVLPTLLGPIVGAQPLDKIFPSELASKVQIDVALKEFIGRLDAAAMEN